MIRALAADKVSWIYLGGPEPHLWVIWADWQASHSSWAVCFLILVSRAPGSAFASPILQTRKASVPWERAIH